MRFLLALAEAGKLAAAEVETPSMRRHFRLAPQLRNAEPSVRAPGSYDLARDA